MQINKIEEIFNKSKRKKKDETKNLTQDQIEYYNHNYINLKWRLYKYFKRVKKDIGRRTKYIFRDVRGSHDAIIAFLENEYTKYNIKIRYEQPNKKKQKNKKSKVGRKRKYWCLIKNPFEGNKAYERYIFNKLQEELEILNGKDKSKIAYLEDFKDYYWDKVDKIKLIYLIKGRGRPIKFYTYYFPTY